MKLPCFQFQEAYALMLSINAFLGFIFWAEDDAYGSAGCTNGSDTSPNAAGNVRVSELVSKTEASTPTKLTLFRITSV